MLIPSEWQIKAKNKVAEILGEANDNGLLKTPIPINDLIEAYLGDVTIKTTMDNLFPVGVSAFSKKYMDIGWLMVINGKESVERQRFSAAHEFGHTVLITNQAKTVYCSRNGKGWDEDMCDQFAGDILMPEILVRKAYELVPSPYVEDIAKMFKVSKPVAEIQLKRLGLPFKVREFIRF